MTFTVSPAGGSLGAYVEGADLARPDHVAAIRQALLDLSARGVAVLVISQDLDELFEICDRLVVIHGGRLSAPRATRATTREAIGLLMAGMGENEHAG